MLHVGEYSSEASHGGVCCVGMSTCRRKDQSPLHWGNAAIFLKHWFRYISELPLTEQENDEKYTGVYKNAKIWDHIKDHNVTSGCAPGKCHKPKLCESLQAGTKWLYFYSQLTILVKTPAFLVLHTKTALRQWNKIKTPEAYLLVNDDSIWCWPQVDPLPGT